MIQIQYRWVLHYHLNKISFNNFLLLNQIQLNKFHGNVYRSIRNIHFVRQFIFLLLKKNIRSLSFSISLIFLPLEFSCVQHYITAIDPSLFFFVGKFSALASSIEKFEELFHLKNNFKVWTAFQKKKKKLDVRVRAVLCYFFFLCSFHSFNR